MTRFVATLILVLLPGIPALAEEFPLEMLNLKSGISMSLSGENGKDWAVERTFHDDAIADEIIYLRSTVQIALAHNERNSLVLVTPKVPRVLGVNGPDGKPDSGDEGEIHWKIDRDQQAHPYVAGQGSKGAMRPFTPKYAGPFSFETLTYDGSRKVLGSTGDNGGRWGTCAKATSERFCYGHRDSFGNQWHTLTYWDDDVPLLRTAGVDPHRQGASDGHSVTMCVDPKTPVLQFHASGADQFYSTPAKTYFIPKIWEQTTYLTGGVRISFVNLTNAEAVMYRVDGGEFRTWDGQPLTAAGLLAKRNQPSLLEAKCGAAGAVLKRTLILDPDYPAPQERHGFLLWADESEAQAVRKKLHDVEPFRRSYRTLRDDWNQGSGERFDNVRGIWRSGADAATKALNNALVVAIEGPKSAAAAAWLSKTRLLRMARLEPVGFEIDIDDISPGKDYLNELGQTVQLFADAGVAYDLLVSCDRKAQDPEGVTPIEELLIRDGLAKTAKTILQFRDNTSFTSGSGDTHWGHGYDLALGTIALAMPTYKTPYYGTSGGDRKTANDLRGSDGKFWNPLPDQPVTWYDAATDAGIATPGYPNVAAPFRAEFILTDDGWWSGANDLQGDGDRYPSGMPQRKLVDVKWGGMANAQCRVELVEMAGYESPFVERLYALDFMRRIKGDENRALCVTNYLRRRLVCGVVPLKWDAPSKSYTVLPPRVDTALLAFNCHYPFASLPGVVSKVQAYLASPRASLVSAYALALCADPAGLPAASSGREPDHPPVLKPLFKYVVKPGETLSKTIIAEDLDDDPLQVTVEGLPPGAAYDAASRRITWTPQAQDTGVYLVQVTADDGKAKTVRPYPIVVNANAGKMRFAARPTGLAAAVAGDGGRVELTWKPPAGAEPKAYLIYRDGVLWGATPGTVTRFTDRELLSPSASTRYHLSTLDAQGSESEAIEARPAVLRLGGGRLSGQKPSNLALGP